MSRTDPAPEASMEEILASIRRIITEDPGEDRPRPQAMREMAPPPASVKPLATAPKAMDFAGDIARALNETPKMPTVEEDDILDMGGALKQAIQARPPAGGGLQPPKPDPARNGWTPPAGPARADAPAPPQSRASSPPRPQSGLPPIQPAVPTPRAPASGAGPAARPQPPSFSDPTMMPLGPRTAQPQRPAAPPAGRITPAAAGAPGANGLAAQTGAAAPGPGQAKSAAAPGTTPQSRPAAQTPASSHAHAELDDVLDLSRSGSAGSLASFERQPLSERIRVETGDSRLPAASIDADVLDLGPPAKQATVESAVLTNGSEHTVIETADGPESGLSTLEDGSVTDGHGEADGSLDAAVGLQTHSSLSDVSDEAGTGAPQANPSDDSHDATPAAASAEPPLRPVIDASTAAAALIGPNSSRTLEDTVTDLLRPMLRDWLDANMPRIVEKALKDESLLNGSKTYR